MKTDTLTTKPETPAGLTSSALLASLVKHLFGDDETDSETLAEYTKNFELFDAEWKTPKAAGAEYRYCESLHAAGLLECRITPILRHNRASGAMTRFRRNEMLDANDKSSDHAQ